MSEKERGVIWHDRKRFLGMPISFTKYYIKKNRLYTEVGFFSSKEDELLLYRILDFKLETTLFNKIFKVGTITIYTCDETDRELKLVRIKNPKEVRDMLSEMVEGARNRNNIKGREMFGVSRGEYFDNDGDE